MAKPEKPKAKKGRCKADPGNSERPLIELLKSVITDMMAGVNSAIEDFRDALRHQETKQIERDRKIMTALETLTASVNAATTAQSELTTAVNAAIVQLGTPGATDAQLLSLAAAVDASTASDAALTAALTAAVNPPAPTP